MNMANTIVGSMAPRRRRGARRNPMKSGGKVLLGAAVVAAIGGAGYLLFVKKASGAPGTPGGNAPAALQLSPAGGLQQTVSAAKGQQVVVTMPGAAGVVYAPNAAGGVSLTNSTATVFTFTANASGTITIGLQALLPGNPVIPALSITVNVS